MFKKFVAATVLALCSTGAALAADASFSRDAAIRVLGYEPENVAPICKSPSVAATGETGAVAYLMAAGQFAAQRVACPNVQSKSAVTPFVNTGAQLPASECIAAAAGAGDKITMHVSEMMNSEHPDVVAAFTDGVARALENMRDACTASKEVWAKVAAQAMLFQNRAATLRDSRVCALWRLALDRELKSATEAGKAQGKAAGLARFQRQVKAAQDGTHQYCGDDSASGMIDANVDLTKMLLDTMP